jgi:hypothetical protein
LEQVWALMGFPCRRYCVLTRELRLTSLAEAGRLNNEFATAETISKSVGEERSDNRLVFGACSRLDAVPEQQCDQTLTIAA